MTLLNYLQSIDWSAGPLNSDMSNPADETLAQLLDLDLSVDLADVIDTFAPGSTVATSDVQLLLTPALVLQRSLDDMLERYGLALLNWERGRYRIVHGRRARVLMQQEGFGKADNGSERWVRSGRMIWLSVLEFTETHFKRARMKMRVAQTTFRGELTPVEPPLEQLLKLDHILLKAKLRRLDEAAIWLVRAAQTRFRQQWQKHRPALETEEALDVLVMGLSIDGWLGTFIKEFGRAFELVLTMEVDAATVLHRAFALHEDVKPS